MAFPFRSANIAGGESGWPDTYASSAMVPVTPAPWCSDLGSPLVPVTILPPYPEDTAIIDQDATGTEYAQLSLPDDLDRIAWHGHKVKQWVVDVNPVGDTPMVNGWDFPDVLVPFQMTCEDSTDDVIPPPNRIITPGGNYTLAGGITYAGGTGYTLTDPDGFDYENMRVKWTINVTMGRFRHYLPGNRAFAKLMVQAQYEWQQYDSGLGEWLTWSPFWEEAFAYPEPTVTGGASTYWWHPSYTTPPYPAGTVEVKETSIAAAYMAKTFNSGQVDTVMEPTWDVDIYPALLHTERADL